VLGALSLMVCVVERMSRVTILNEMHYVLDDFSCTGDHAIDHESGYVRMQLGHNHS